MKQITVFLILLLFQHTLSAQGIAFNYESAGDRVLRFPCVGQIGDRVWNDMNQNGLQNIGEPGIGGVTVKLLNKTNVVLQTFISDSTGNGLISTNTFNFGIPTNYLTPGVQGLAMNWDFASGNLTSRTDGALGESFTYDNLNRLTDISSSGSGIKNMVYHSNGNIMSKTDAGTYEYKIPKINAVTKINPATDNIPTDIQSINYNSFLQPTILTEKDYKLDYTYAADEHRIKSVMTKGEDTVYTRYYFDDFEIHTDSLSSNFIHYVSGGDGLAAIVVQGGIGAGTYYTYTDHLGSILKVTNSGGALEANQSFDAWGRYRNAANWTYDSIVPPPSWLYRGYTGHEHIPQMNLINMNGRMYDPVVGRMLAVDNFIQDAGYTQSYDRYGYVMNNPMKYTDPDGEWVHIALGALIGGVINGIVHAHRDGGFWKGFAIGAVAGAFTAATGGASAGWVAAGKTLGGATLRGVATGAVSSAAGSFYLTTGNAAVFGDEFSWKTIGRDALFGGITGGIASGIGFKINSSNSKPPSPPQKNAPGKIARTDTWTETVSGLGDPKYIGETLEEGLFFDDLVVTAGKGAKGGYSSFNAFIAAYGSAGKGNAWHHIVEQGGNNVSRFGAETIHNANNLMKLPHGAGSIHVKVSGFYSSKQVFTGGQTVRQWLSNQSYQQQYDFGIKTLKQFGWTP